MAHAELPLGCYVKKKMLHIFSSVLAVALGKLYVIKNINNSDNTEKVTTLMH